MSTTQPDSKASRVLDDLLRSMGDQPSLTDQEKAALRRKVKDRLKATS